jgi:hypothetical protein
VGEELDASRAARSSASIASRAPESARSQTIADRAADLTESGRAALDSFTRGALGSTSAAVRRRARFAVVEMPVAAVISHVRVDERPPAIVVELVAAAYRGVMGSGRAGQDPVRLPRAVRDYEPEETLRRFRAKFF